jgi:hypothetical protein
MALTTIQNEPSKLILCKKGNRPAMSMALKWSVLISVLLGILFLALGFDFLISLLILISVFTGIYATFLLIFFLLLEADTFYVFDKNEQTYKIQSIQPHAKGKIKQSVLLQNIQKVFTQYNDSDDETFLMLELVINGSKSEQYLDIASGKDKFQAEKEMIEKFLNL